MACFLFLKSGTELEPFERLRKNPGRLFAGAGTARVFELEDGACEALDPASDLSDRLPEKTAARRRMVEDVEVDEALRFFALLLSSVFFDCCSSVMPFFGAELRCGLITQVVSKLVFLPRPLRNAILSCLF